MLSTILGMVDTAVTSRGKIICSPGTHHPALGEIDSNRNHEHRVCQE